MSSLADRCRRVADSCAATRVRQVARAVSQRYDGALRAAGLAPTQFTVLVSTTLAGAAGIPLSALARVLVLDRTSLTRTLAPLEKAGLVWTGPARADGRVRLVRITPAGTRRLALALPLWEKAQAAFERRAGAEWPETHERLGRVLKSLTP